MKYFNMVIDAILSFYGSGKCAMCDRPTGHFGGNCAIMVDTTPVKKK